MTTIGLHAVYPPEFAPANEDNVAQSRRATDVMRLNVPLPFTITLIAMAIGIAAAVWRIEANVSNINIKIEYERQLDAERQRALDLRFEALNAQIQAAGLRGTSMTLSSALAAEQAKKR